MGSSGFGGLGFGGFELFLGIAVLGFILFTIYNFLKNAAEITGSRN